MILIDMLCHNITAPVYECYVKSQANSIYCLFRLSCPCLLKYSAFCNEEWSNSEKRTIDMLFWAYIPVNWLDSLSNTFHESIMVPYWIIFFSLFYSRMLLFSAKFSRKVALVQGLGSSMGHHLTKQNGIMQKQKLLCFLWWPLQR